MEESLVFARKFVDHQVRFRQSGKTIATFADCELTTFKFDLEHSILSFHLLVKKTSGDGLAKLIDTKRAAMAVEIKRAKHWSSQPELDLGDKGEEEEGDAGAQSDLTEEQQKQVERNKEKVNKANTDKARGRTK